MSASTTVIDLLRHGETRAGAVFCGQLDAPLSDNGWTQMRDALGGKRPWQRLISSPLRRCAAFADDFGQRYGLAVAREPRWQEMHFGDWEGCSAADLTAQNPQALEAFWQDPLRHSPPGGESLSDFRQRVLDAWHHWLAQVRGEHCLVVTHGGVMRLLIAHTLGMPLTHLLRLDIPHAAMAQLKIEAIDDTVCARLVSLSGSQ